MYTVPRRGTASSNLSLSLISVKDDTNRPTIVGSINIKLGDLLGKCKSDGSRLNHDFKSATEFLNLPPAKKGRTIVITVRLLQVAGPSESIQPGVCEDPVQIDVPKNAVHAGRNDTQPKDNTGVDDVATSDEAASKGLSDARADIRKISHPASAADTKLVQALDAAAAIDPGNNAFLSSLKNVTDKLEILVTVGDSLSEVSVGPDIMVFSSTH